MSKNIEKRGLLIAVLATVLASCPTRSLADTGPKILLKCSIIDSKMIEVLEVTPINIIEIAPAGISEKFVIVHWRTSSTQHFGTMDPRYIIFDNKPDQDSREIARFKWIIDRHTGAMARKHSGTIAATCMKIEREMISE